jgi:hypothetical protein
MAARYAGAAGSSGAVESRGSLSAFPVRSARGGGPRGREREVEERDASMAGASSQFVLGGGTVRRSHDGFQSCGPTA